jgi:hypothetical protein
MWPRAASAGWRPMPYTLNLTDCQLADLWFNRSSFVAELFRKYHTSPVETKKFLFYSLTVRKFCTSFLFISIKFLKPCLAESIPSHTDELYLSLDYTMFGKTPFWCLSSVTIDHLNVCLHRPGPIFTGVTWLIILGGGGGGRATPTMGIRSQVKDSN